MYNNGLNLFAENLDSTGKKFFRWMLIRLFSCRQKSRFFRKKPSSRKIHFSVTRILLLFCLCMFSCKTHMMGGGTTNLGAKARMAIAESKYIVHAGGFVSDDSGEFFSYTNSREPLMKSAADGNRIFEIDFRISSDGFLVCTHEWNQAYRNGVPLQGAVTKDEFLLSKIYGKFSPMDLSDIAYFARIHPDCYFITDIKDDNRKACLIIARECPDILDRFIIQIYHMSELDIIRRLGFRNVILTLYRAAPSERRAEQVAKFAQMEKLVGVTYWHYWADEYLECFRQAGVHSYVHTVNNLEEREQFLRRGVAAIYTDVTENR